MYKKIKFTGFVSNRLIKMCLRSNTVSGTLLLLMLCFIVSEKLEAQQSAVYSQYMFNSFLINPAAAGGDGATSINLTGREQWIGWPGTPKTHSITAQTRVLKNSFIAKALTLRKKFSKRSKSGRVGLGINFYNDLTQSLTRTGFQIAYGYHIPLRQSQLSFGLALAPYQLYINREYVMSKAIDPNDNILQSIQPRYVIDGNFGAQFTTPTLIAGFSVTDLFKASIAFGGKDNAGYEIARQYNFLGAYKIEINKYVLLEPSTWLKISESGAFQMDMGARAYYREEYWGGLAYRTGAGAGSLILLAGLRVNKFYIGYAFDYEMSEIRKYTFGSHEFMFTVKFGDNARRYRWLNRY